MKTLYYKITPTVPGDSIWYARGLQTHDTPEASLKHLQKLALKRGLPCAYELATAEQYRAYRDQIAAVIERAPRGGEDHPDNGGPQ